MPGAIYRRHLLARPIALLRRIEELKPGTLLPELMSRLAYLSLDPYKNSRPRDAYSGGDAEAVRGQSGGVTPLPPAVASWGESAALPRHSDSSPRSGQAVPPLVPIRPPPAALTGGPLQQGKHAFVQFDRRGA